MARLITIYIGIFFSTFLVAGKALSQTAYNYVGPNCFNSSLLESQNSNNVRFVGDKEFEAFIQLGFCEKTPRPQSGDIGVSYLTSPRIPIHSFNQKADGVVITKNGTFAPKHISSFETMDKYIKGLKSEYCNKYTNNSPNCSTHYEYYRCPKDFPNYLNLLTTENKSLKQLNQDLLKFEKFLSDIIVFNKISKTYKNEFQRIISAIKKMSFNSGQEILAAKYLYEKVISLRLQSTIIQKSSTDSSLKKDLKIINSVVFKLGLTLQFELKAQFKTKNQTIDNAINNGD